MVDYPFKQHNFLIDVDHYFNDIIIIKCNLKCKKENIYYIYY